MIRQGEKGDIIAVASSKGGPGKTNTSGCTGDALAYLGYKVAILDVDPNQNMIDWSKKGKEISKASGQPNSCFPGITFASQLVPEEIVKDCRRLAKEHDFVIIDGAGVNSQSMYFAAGVSSLVIIPVMPSEDDFKEALRTRKVVASAAETISVRFGKDFEIPTRILINATQPDTVVHKHIMKELERRNVPVFQTAIGYRTIFKKARILGSTPVRVEPAGAGAREIMDVAQEIVALLGVEKNGMKIAI
jgi:chromosome partitioning protein